MIQKDAKAYHVLEILSMAGEVGEDMVSLLIPQPDYRKKILQRLLLENKIVRYQKDRVKGYRLTISGKRWMLQSDYNRFSYFLANGADASMRRSDLIHRKRQHRLAEMMALFFLAGTNLFRKAEYLSGTANGVKALAVCFLQFQRMERHGQPFYEGR